jgi:RecB family exonuclease
VVLSFQTVDDDARELARSPVIERQLLAEGTSPAEPAPSLHAREQPPFARPAFEHAVVAGLLDARASFERALSAAARERGDPPARADARARTRIAILEEIEPGRRSAAPGPYFGWVGPPRELGDPRRALYYVTRLESLARCPWQTFLARVLRLEAPPDALEVLPRLHAGAIGNAVHRALERIVGNGLVDASRSLSETLRRPAVKIDWPSPETLETILLEACERAARDGGIALPGFERALAELARPYLARARALLFADGSGLLALGVEVEGELDAHGKEPVRFKADLVEERGGTRFVWDYKTGTVDPFAPAPASKLRERLIEGAASGAFLQAAAYTAAARHEQARGGYAFLGGSFAQEPALVACDPEDTELDASLSETLELLRGAVEAGTFPPRLELTSGSEPSRCGWCELGAACLRGDSGPRRRLRSWVDREPEGMDEKERVYRALYRGGVQR